MTSLNEIIHIFGNFKNTKKGEEITFYFKKNCYNNIFKVNRGWKTIKQGADTSVYIPCHSSCCTSSPVLHSCSFLCFNFPSCSWLKEREVFGRPYNHQYILMVLNFVVDILFLHSMCFLICDMI